MASFTDKIHGFSPYIEEMPSDAYLRVGMFKQQQTDEGIQKVQSYIDAVAGLPVVKQEDKDYIQGKLGQIQEGVTKNLSGDFSDARITNQVGGAVKQVFGDPIVKTAVSSSAYYTTGLQAIKDAQKDGKSSPANEWLYNKQASSWLNDKKAGSQFSGQYIPYTDIGAKILKTVKEIDPDSKLTEIPFKRNADGSYQHDDAGRPIIDDAILETSTSGKSIDKIKQSLTVALNDQDYQQLGIDGAYHYKDYSPLDMGNIVKQNAQTRINEATDKINYLKAQQMTNTTDKEFQARLLSDVNSYTSQIDGIQKQVKGSYENISKNPEGFKSSFYTQNYLDQSANALSSSNTSFKYVDNPYRKQANWQEDFNQKARDASEKIREFEADLQYKYADLAEKIAKNKKDKSLLTDEYVNLPVPTDVKSPTEYTWQQDIQARQNSLDILKSDFVSKAFPEMDAKSADAAIELQRQAWQEGKEVNPLVNSYFNNEQTIKRDLDNKKQSLINLQNTADKNKDFDMSKILGKYKPVSIEGVSFTPKELVNIDSKYQSLIHADQQVNGLGVNNPFSNTLNEDESRFSPKEKIVYNVMKKHYYGQPLSQEEQNIFDNTNTISQDLSNNAPGILQKRNDFINGGLEKIDAVGVPRARQLDVSTEAKRQQISGSIALTLEGISRQGGGVENNTKFDIDLVKKLNDPSKTNTNYALSQDRDGNWSYIISSPGEKTQPIPVGDRTVKTLFGNDVASPFENVKHTLALTNNRTTNVIGTGPSTAYFQKNDFPNVSKYGITADVEGLTDGGYQLKLHIFENGQWKDIVAPKAFYNEAELLKSISDIGDLTIKQLLDRNANR